MPNPIGVRIASLTTPTTTATTAVTSTTATTPTPPTTGTVGMGPTTVQLGPPPMTFDGVASAVAQKRTLPGYRPAAGTTAAPGSSSTFGNGRGYIETTATPVSGGWQIDVDVHHNKPGDDVSLFVSSRITDVGNGKEAWVVMGMPVAGPMAGTDGKDKDGMLITKKSFFVSLADMNAWLAKKAGNKPDGTPKLQFQPGDPLSVDAKWQDGHEAGGRRDQRYGYINTPPLPQTTSPIGTRDPNVVISKPITMNAASKPIDLTVKLPDTIIKKYPLVFTPTSTLSSHREEELKFSPKTFDELKALTDKLVTLAKMPAAQQAVEMEKMLGEKGWKLELSDRYFQKDQNGGYVYYAPGEKVWTVKDEKGEHPFDFAGLPKVAPMHDQYQDVTRGPEPDKNSPDHWRWQSAQPFSVANINGAMRFRDGEIKGGQVLPTMGEFEMKPGGGVMDPYSMVATRLEYALETNPGIGKDPKALAQMAEFLDKEAAPFNVMKEMKKVSYNVSGNAIKSNILDNNADRYKFNLESATGLKVEISCDFVSITSKNQEIESPSTKGKTQDQKYDYWQGEFAKAKKTFDTTPGAKNTETFVEYSNNGQYRVETTVEVSIDAAGKKSVTETLNVKGLQVEIEMEHLGIRNAAGAPVQAGGASSANKQERDPTDVASEDKLFQSFSDNLTFAGPPTIHNVSDLSDPSLYEDDSYLEMRKAGILIVDAAFPNGVNRTRQKAAYGLQMMGAIEALKMPDLTAEITSGKKLARGLGITADNQKVSIRGAQFTGGAPLELTLMMEGFPVKIAFKGNETNEQVKDAIAAEFKKFKLYEPKVTAQKEDFWDTTATPQVRKQRTVYDVELVAK